MYIWFAVLAIEFLVGFVGLSGALAAGTNGGLLLGRWPAGVILPKASATPTVRLQPRDVLPRVYNGTPSTNPLIVGIFLR